MEPSYEIFESGPIRVVQTYRDNEYIYTFTLDDFSQMIMDQRAFNHLMDLMVAFSKEMSSYGHIDPPALASSNIEQLEFEIQEGEYG